MLRFKLDFSIAYTGDAFAHRLPDEAKFVARNANRVIRIIAKFEGMNANDAAATNRYLILSVAQMRGAYVQCLFCDDEDVVLCEVASPYYQPKTAPPARLAYLAELGYNLDASEGNYVRRFSSGTQTARTLSKFLLISLYRAFLNRPTRVKLNSPWL